MNALTTPRALLAALLLGATLGCAGLGGGPSVHPYHDIGDVGRTVTTDSGEAQLWFDRGLALCFGFNHEEAVRCFDRAIELDPSCAMAYWGKAYALGPNYNNPMPEGPALELAQATLREAKGAIDRESELERALIAALEVRFVSTAEDQREAQDRRFADEMRKLRARFPNDRDVAAWTAEALMQQRPWGLWSKDGEPAAETPEIRAVLEESLARWPNHPALCHLYIHAMEAGPEVARALPAARRLETLTPGLGHLVHMPSHIYIWTGHYDDAIRTNIDACRVDDAYVALSGKENMYTAYRIHNFHFVTYGAMWDGQSEIALKYARQIREEIPASLLANIPDLFEIFLATPYHAQIRFGQWEEILEEPEPPVDQPSVRAVHFYARGVALASLDRVDEALVEQKKFQVARAAVPESRILFNNLVSDVLSVADKVLDGEIEYRRGNYERAFALLREAVKLDEALNYDEPWGWMEPARHALGALLTEQGHFAEALTVYQKNLDRYPNNGWALHGLAECLDGLGRREEAKEARAAFEKAFARADVEIPGSCFCKGIAAN